MKTTIIRILLRSSLIIVGILGIVFTFLTSKFMGGWHIFLYFTVQSNIWIMAITAYFLVNDFLLIFHKKAYVSRFVLYLKYIFTVAITITFIVFFTMLAPVVGMDYFLSFNNFSLHGIVPILAIVDFFAFCTDIKLTPLKSLLGDVTPLYYLAFVFIGVPLNFRYGENQKFPYFFLNYEKYGWLNITNEGLGVIYWIIIFVICASGLCLLFYLLMNVRQKHLRKGE